MKKVLLVFALMFSSLNAFAQLEPVPQDQISAYKQAVSLAINSQRWTCAFRLGSDSFYMNAVVTNSSSVEIDRSGAQPVLVFSQYSEDRTEKSVVKVTTAADYKAIVTLDGSRYRISDVNLGTLRDPQIVKDYSLVLNATCDAVN